ncbi:MAG: glycine cleavage system aminomethyltransferase GcvT [Gammaproteobacteria bacterium]|nr:glycine cleavage system aminomethyltransferase GcvT [Gammaproteobacteria bacterium]
MSELARTPLYDLHLELGAKMVPFAGYEMPVQYPAGIMKEHLHTRAQAGLFDVSHMGQVRLAGAQAATALETLVPVDVLDLGLNHQRYALFTNDQGGILDDLMITQAGDHLFVVVNAACKEQDLALLRTLEDRCEVKELSDWALLALQGPQAAQAMARIAPELNRLVFMTAARVEIQGTDCFVTRSGYTGEDGFEISVPAEQAESLARALLAQPEVQPIGLGARDSLRLEAGLCLYGHDIDTQTTPVEASLLWALSKVRRADGARAGGFPGAAVIHRQIAEGVTRKRVGIQPEGKAPVRDGATLVDNDSQPIGAVTSGGFGPSIARPIAMGYVTTAQARVGTELQALVRGKPQPVKVAKLPFVQQRYYRG